ncbi:MAG: DUF1778 domain-containing protein, partial [Acidobacteriia bacterium]|nr:DUF1778 domain-containing protein [Terriglobia bacterium]
PYSVAQIEAVSKAETVEVQSADERLGCPTIPLPFDLSQTDREAYFRAVLNPPQPSERLRQALAEYRQRFRK